MEPNFYIIKVWFSIILGLMAIPFLVVGLWGLKVQRPFLISSRGPSSMALVASISVILPLFVLLFSRPMPPLSILSLLLSACSLLMSVGSLLIAYNTMKGYMAFGITYTPFCKGLLATLEKLQLPYEELRWSYEVGEPLSLRRFRSVRPKRLIRLTSAKADLQVYMLMGAAHIKVKQNQHYPLLTEITNAMNQYLGTSSVRTNIIPFVFYLTMVVCLVILIINVLFFPTHLLTVVSVDGGLWGFINVL